MNTDTTQNMPQDTVQQAAPVYPEPPADMKALDRLVGTWRVSGGAQGTTTYEWMQGGFFLLQHVELGHEGHTNKGLEIIGHEQKFGESPSEHIKSRYYGGSGETFDYVYQMDGDILTIWAGDVGSPAYYRGTFSADGNTLTGGWTYPGGGGYEATSTRVR